MSLRRVEMLFMGFPSGSALRSVDIAVLSGCHRQPTGAGAPPPWGELPIGGGTLCYFQNISMPPPTISTPKPAARFQSPMGRGSWPAEM